MSRGWGVAVRVAAVLTLAGAVAGCSNVTPAPVATPTPTVVPIFANDEEALAAATEAYRRYLEVSDAILADGGKDPERIAAVAQETAYDDVLADAAEFDRRQLRIVGRTQLASVELQSVGFGSSVAIYVCDDVSDVDLLDVGGTSLVNPEREVFTAFEIQLVANEESRVLRVAHRALWSGPGICV